MSGSRGTRRRFLLVALAGIAAAVAVGTLLWTRSAPADGGEPGPATRPALLAGVPDIAEARAAITARHPETAGLLDALLREGVETVLRAFPVSEGPCETFLVRGGTRCDASGLAPGTAIRLYVMASESVPGFGVEEAAARASVGYLLQGRHPRLDLIARRDDGAYLVVIGIDRQPDRVFPGGAITGGDVGAIYAVVDTSGKLLDFVGRNASAPALEPIENDIRKGLHSYEILGVSGEFIARDSRIQQELEALRK